MLPNRLISTNALAQSKDYANTEAASILQGLMEGLGWHDLQADILALDAEQKMDEQHLKLSIQNHLEFPTESTRTELLLKLEALKKILQLEHDDAKKLNRIFVAQAMKENNPFVLSAKGWRQWAFDNVKDFFGSSSSALAEKYQMIAENRQLKLSQLSALIEAIQNEKIVTVELEPNLELNSESVLIPEPKISSDTQDTTTEDLKESFMDPPLSSPLQRRLLSTNIVNPIPNQVTTINELYQYSLEDTFSENITLVAMVKDKPLPSWLSIQYKQLYSYLAGEGHADGVAVSGNTLFLANGFAGLQILDISNNISNPYFVAAYPAGEGYAAGVAVSGNTAFLVNSNGLQILDISNITNPYLLASYTAEEGVALGVALSGNTAFLANYNALQILDISNITNPYLLASYPVGEGNAYGVAVSDNTAFLANYNALQILDLTQWKFSATSPSMSDTGNYKVQLVATDFLGGSATSNSFTIRVEGPPQFNGSIANQYAKVQQPFNYFIPQGFCTDPNDDPIGFSAALIDKPLPAWLSFNGVSATFTGIPKDSDVGNFTVVIYATDNIAGTTSTTFDLQINHLPVVATPIPQPPLLRVARDFIFNVPKATFKDTESALIYTATLANGLPLPNWLHFNNSALIFVGKPTLNDMGSLSLRVNAKDYLNESTFAPLTFFVSQNVLPQIVQPISNQLASVGTFFSFSVSPTTFVALEGDTLVYNVSLSDGSNLPGWLEFNDKTLTFSGTPGRRDTDNYAPRILSVGVNAYNYPFVYNSYARANFNINVEGTSYLALAVTIGAPILSALTVLFATYKKRALFLNHLEKQKKLYKNPGVILTIGEAFNYQLKTALEQVYELSVKLPNSEKSNCCGFFHSSTKRLQGGMTMPYWLAYHSKTNHLRSRGPVPEDAEEELIVQVKDKDGLITEKFKLTVIAKEAESLLLAQIPIHEQHIIIDSKETKRTESYANRANVISLHSPDTSVIELTERGASSAQAKDASDKLLLLERLEKIERQLFLRQSAKSESTSSVAAIAQSPVTFRIFSNGARSPGSAQPASPSAFASRTMNAKSPSQS